MTIGKMTFDEYQEHAAQTAIYPNRYEIGGMTYTVLGLNGEAGEIAEKLKKVIRDNGGKVDEAKTYELAKELGDVLWYVAETATQFWDCPWARSRKSTWRNFSAGRSGANFKEAATIASGHMTRRKGENSPKANLTPSR